MSIIIKDILDDQYCLVEGGASFEVKGFSIRIQSTDEGVAVEIYKYDNEIDAIASCYAFDAEITQTT
jgi:hypothetical protein